MNGYLIKRRIMENEIISAEEFVNQYNWENSSLNIPEVLIGFAKLHVQAAIKECIESAPSGSSTDTVSYKDVKYALEDCYPLDNIK
jgi:hypothetical protein